MSVLASEHKKPQSANFLSDSRGRQLVNILKNASMNQATWISGMTASDYKLIKRQIGVTETLFFVAGTPTGNHFAFGPLHDLLQTFIAYAEKEAPEVLTECAPELLNILPEFAKAPFAEGIPPLESMVPIPLGLARMLPRQSEYLLRIISKIGWFITETIQQSSLSQCPVVLYFPQVDRVDRPTLYTIYHLYQRARLGNFTLLLTSDQLPVAEDMLTRQHLFDTDYEYKLLLTRFFTKLTPTIEHLPKGTTPLQPLATNGFYSKETAVYQKAKTALEDLTTLEAQATIIDALSLSNQYFNMELILDTVAEILSTSELDNAFRITMWKIAGSTHAALGNYAQATECFQKASALAGDKGIMKAQISMYLALVSAKRIGAFDEASTFLEAGYQAIETQDIAQAALERGWLNNVNALIAYRNRNYRRAFSLTQDAIQFMKPYRDEESTGLKTNLVTNVSILFESANQPQRALEVWRLFKTFLGEANDLFDKHYLSREAGLSLKADLIAEATTSYHKAFEAAVRVGDFVGIEATARALVCLSHRTQAHAEAAAWAKQIPPLWERLGDYEQLWRSWLMLAACYYFLHDTDNVSESLHRAVYVLTKLNQQHDHQEVTAVLRQVQSNALDAVDWSTWMPELPGTILRWSPHLIVP